MVPLNQLSSESQRLMADSVDRLELGIGEELSLNEQSGWFVYLEQGKLDLLDVDRQPILVEAGEDRANHPLFKEGEDRVSLVALSSCRLLRFEKQLFNQLLEQELLMGTAQDDCAAGMVGAAPSTVSEVEGLLYNEITHAYNVGSLKLSSLPEIASKIKKALARPNITTPILAQIVTMDPALGIQLVSHAKHKVSEEQAAVADKITGIESAIAVLGLDAARALIKTLVTEPLFETQSPRLKRYMQDAYRRSADIATLSYAVATQAELADADHMRLAGLCHEIGTLLILVYIETTGLEVGSDQELDGMIEHLQLEVGQMAVRYWQLGDDLLDVIKHSEHWQWNVQSQLHSCDIVIVAKAYRCLQHHQLEGLPKIEEIPAFAKVFPGEPDPGRVQHIFAQAREHAQVLMNFIKS